MCSSPPVGRAISTQCPGWSAHTCACTQPSLPCEAAVHSFPSLHFLPAPCCKVTQVRGEPLEYLLSTPTDPNMCPAFCTVTAVITTLGDAVLSTAAGCWLQTFQGRVGSALITTQVTYKQSWKQTDETRTVPEEGKFRESRSALHPL